MTSRDFCYWLQGYFELGVNSGGGLNINLNAAQVDVIRKHLTLVFVHEIDPSAGPPVHQAELNKVHSGTSAPKIGGVDPISGMTYRC